MHSNQYILKMKVCQTLRTVTWRETDSERVRNTDWCGFELCVPIYEKECICYHEWDILEEKLQVEDVDSVTQHLDLDVTCLNHLVLATSYVAFTGM